MCFGTFGSIGACTCLQFLHVESTASLPSAGDFTISLAGSVRASGLLQAALTLSFACRWRCQVYHGVAEFPVSCVAGNWHALRYQTRPLALCSLSGVRSAALKAAPGRGTYFAESITKAMCKTCRQAVLFRPFLVSSQADEYAKPDDDGLCCVLVCGWLRLLEITLNF